MGGAKYSTCRRSTFLQRENPELWILSRKLDSLRRLTVPLMLNTGFRGRSNRFRPDADSVRYGAERPAPLRQV